MKCQILFSRKNKKNINLSSAELAKREVKIKMTHDFSKRVNLPLEHVVRNHKC